MRKTTAGLVRRYPVIDICCGTGVQLKRIADSGGEAVCGLDFDRRVLFYAGHKYDFPLVQGDAGRLPFSSGVFGTAVISFALHDKKPAFREKMLREARRVLHRGGDLLLVDFERPWDRKSRWGAAFSHLIELTAGREHYRNGREFLRSGGLSGFTGRYRLRVVTHHRIAGGGLGIVLCRFPEA
jgi:ubiquinone/menaquinone biosynthesis C-methylase UbiE